MSLIFNNWGVVVGGSYTHRPQQEQDIVIGAFEEITYKASVEVISEVQQYFVDRGLMASMVPHSLTADGMCNPEAKALGLCKPLKASRDVCAGCGKSYLAGSYYQPSRCVPQQPSDWQKRMSSYITQVIENHGGVSTTAPLTTIPGGDAIRIEPTKKR